MISKKKIICLISVLVIFTGISMANGSGRSSTNYAIKSDVLDGGGGKIASTGYRLLSALAQSSAIGTSSVVNYDNHSGFWYSVYASAAGAITGDLNGDDLVDQTDLSLAMKVLAGMNPGGIRLDYATCGADVNEDGKIGMEEVIYIKEKIEGIR